ncbi:MAG TPA: glutamate--tRNA ligase [Sphingobacterium sp.]|nr:glutamate--tRNA ligase [Sphingobacterium sp.]
MSSIKKIRVRFAPSPTGGLHLGGVRTALFNYLFAKHNGGDFILRIEDTDQSRFVAEAETYINECLAWCGLQPDESPEKGGNFGPYRQSERKESYRKYAEKLVEDGFAYYAFDTPEELDRLRTETPNFKYSSENRLSLKNSLTLPKTEVQKRIAENHPHTIRMKVPVDKNIVFNDLIRGEISFNSKLLDDKVLLKADGMPTYHLAVVVDDHAMDISHVFRGEEWLSSAPIHVLLWKYLGWEDKMPEWAHLPLILKPDGNGKLSKRDGDRLGFPVYAMNWKDPKSGELTTGFRELGFLPEAFVNMLALLGWNDGTDQEIFTLEELIKAFSLDKIGKSGAKFDYEKAKWFNHIWINTIDHNELAEKTKIILNEHAHSLTDFSDGYFSAVLEEIKERLNFLEDFWSQASFFFQQPKNYDLSPISKKWDDDKTIFFENIQTRFEEAGEWKRDNIEKFYKDKIIESGMKMGALMLPLRIMLVGGKFGPDVFKIAELLGKHEVVKRISYALKLLNEEN